MYSIEGSCRLVFIGEEDSGNKRFSIAVSSSLSGSGHDNRAFLARIRYSATVERAMEQLLAIERLLKPSSHFNRKISFMFRIDNLFLLIKPPQIFLILEYGLTDEIVIIQAAY
jgi:hypothetical protein